MVIVEKSFPRGGVAPKNVQSHKKEEIIFGTVQRKVKKTSSRQKNKISNWLKNDKNDERLETFSAELLNYETIQEGMVIMGIVKKVDRLSLSVYLPGRMIAKVSTLEVSNSYTKSMQEYLDLDNSISKDMYKSLQELYHPGQMIYGRVQDIKNDAPGRVSINMTLKPSEVHADLTHTNIRKGFVFNGAVEEVQEHGYVIESGIKGLRCFLPLEKSRPGHIVGELLFLKVEKVTHDKTVSTSVCKEVEVDNLKIKNQSDPNLDYILPSTIVQFTVTKNLKDGLQGSIMNEAFTAYVNEHQLNEPLALPEDFKVNSTLNARVLYVMPLTKLVYLTLNLHNSASQNTDLEEQLKRGDVIEDAKVHHLGTGGVVLVLNNKYKGVISYKTIKANYRGNYDQDELLTKYAKKTTHKVRVLDFDPIDSLYICTDDSATVNEKFFTLNDLKPGDFVTAIVKEQNTKFGGYILQVGKLKGVIEKYFLAPTPKTLEKMSKLRCRVVGVNVERNSVYLTNRAEYMSSDSKLLTSFDDAKVNASFMGTIVKSNDNYVLVKFFGDVKGMLYKKSSAKFGDVENFHEGQTMPFRILNKKDEKITLGLEVNTFRVGEVYPVTIVHSLDSALEIKINSDTEEHKSEMKGLVPMELLSDFTDLLKAKLHMFPIGTETQAACVVGNVFSIRDVDYCTQHLKKHWRSIQVGDILKAFVKDVSEDIVELIIPIRGYGKFVKVHSKMFLINAFSNANVTLTPEQVIYVKVLSKEEIVKSITVSAKLTDVWDSQMSSTALYLEKYLKEVSDIRTALKKEKHAISSYSIGDRVSAEFQGVNPTTNDWQFTLKKTSIAATIKASLVGKTRPPKVGSDQECVVLWIDYSNSLVYLSNKSSDMEHIISGEEIPDNLIGKSGLQAKVLFKGENVFICSLKKGKYPLIYCPTRMHFNDFEKSASAIVSEGDFCRLAFIHGSRPIALHEDTFKMWKEIDRKRKTLNDNNAPDVKRSKLSEEQRIEVISKKKSLANSHNLSKSSEKTLETTEEDGQDILFYEDKKPSKELMARIVTFTETGQETIKQNNAKVKTSLSGIGDFWTTDLSELNSGDVSTDEDADAESTNKHLPKKRLSAAEKFKQQREEEARLQAIEKKYADPNEIPESVDQFDRVVLSDPNNSKNWINYMVFHLQSAEIEKARSVARRAIKTISYRNADDLLNVWVGLLNLELRYGSKDTFDEVLKEALMYNEPIKVYLRALEILSEAKKTQELIEMIASITKKFKTELKVWLAAANAFFVIGMPERAQQLLHKALACLPEREHVNTIVSFANMNHKHGNNEIAQTLLDQVVTSYPKRVDVWTQYVDMLVKEDLIGAARNILERAVIQKIPLKKMRTIFKKYLEFEQRFGTDEDVEKVKQLATKFVKNAKNL